jgi:hypothetical protein
VSIIIQNLELTMKESKKESIKTRLQMSELFFFNHLNLKNVHTSQNLEKVKYDTYIDFSI